MIESFGDVTELLAMIIMVAVALKLLYNVNVKNKEEVMKKREARYYRVYDDNDAYFSEEDDDEDEPYLGD